MFKRKITAALVAAGVSITTFAAVPTADAAPLNTNYTDITGSNWNAFKGADHSASYFSITVRATSSRGGKGIPGRAALKIDGKLQRVRYLDHGNITFHISRKILPNNRTAQIGVRIFPSFEPRPEKVVLFDVKDTPKPSASGGSKVVAAALAQVGDAYKYGASGMSSWDCSGLTAYAVRKGTGKHLPHSSAAQKNSGHRVSKAQARPGDLVYTPGHIAVLAGSGTVIEAATPATGVVHRKMWQRGEIYIRP